MHNLMSGKVEVQFAGNGRYIVKGALIKDMGDGVPWPYDFLDVCIDFDELCTTLRRLYGETCEPEPAEALA